MTVLSDSFQRANENPITGWTEEGTADWQIVSNQASKGAGTTLVGSIMIAGTLFTTDQYAQGTLVTMPVTTAARHTGPMVRKHNTDATRTCYSYQISGGPNGSRQLVRFVAGVKAVLQSDSAEPALPIVIRVEAKGSTIRGFQGGVEAFSVTDTTITTGTKTGWHNWDGSATVFDNFQAGDLLASLMEWDPIRRMQGNRGYRVVAF